MDFIDKAIQDYSELNTKAESPWLNQLNRHTHTNVLKPRMLSGHLQGRFLSMMSHLCKPLNVLDIGTYTGYSALCLAEGLGEFGKVYSIDNNEELMLTASEFIQKSPYADKISLITGDALTSIKHLNEQVNTWDLVWIDADKSEYMAYYELLIDKVRPGGLIMADNVLWSGKILDKEEILKDRDTAILNEFNNKITADSRVDNLLLPIRDGIMMLRKL
ncbi:MAG: class I SAM-dependent methyltransferase [Bacteroidia bacterium]|nr:class I SAM-dependent methyltransferase [Bacteroidia bacterium]